MACDFMQHHVNQRHSPARLEQHIQRIGVSQRDEWSCIWGQDNI
jgi:hypothetical protein